ncbi:hypothetical protein BD289DRAFT_487254 [Coniella lustricola]|uniref:Calpain catalytic domain-containing protein n=1 Tax=Coniella lustricola TaxID=2025994 RepID=A0A2T2ZSF4_9PEZI|nr:hypothetical protein BD289DRAFT_487254 [Coniella lustricola]
MEARAREVEARIGSASGKQALASAIEAAELYMKAVKEAPAGAEKSRLKRKCHELIALAETLKIPARGPTPATPATASSSVSKTPQPRQPRQTRELPTAEKTILLRASKLHGSVFPPWDAHPDPAVFRSKRLDEPPFTDSSVFSFSAKQAEIFDGWKRPAEIFNDSGPELYENIMVARTDCDLVQDITTDCSVVASLCAVMRHLKPGKKGSLLPSLLFPFDYERDRPIASQNGKYMFRLNFNGCFRQVVVDDRLPAAKTSRTFFVVDRRNPELIWPALMEKAYLKIRGGYDFPGSNSGTDLWVLTGWIPEQVFFQSDDTELDQVWKRTKASFEYGDVVVTLGTGHLSRQEEETLGLAGEHDYAVMDLKVTDTGERRMLLKNPWCNGLVWKGFGSTATVDAAAYPPPSPTLSRPHLGRPAQSDTASEGMTGTFWISYDDVVHNFESLYLNWNPTLFTDRQDHHFVWQLPPRTMQRSLAHNPQYRFTSPSSGAVWILLSRHFQDGELPIARSRAARQPPAKATHQGSTPATATSLGFMSIYLFDKSRGCRVQLPGNPPPAHQSPFVDSPQTLLRFNAEPNKPYTVVVAQEGFPLPSYSFTLSFFSRAPLSVSQALPPLAHYTEVSGSWTRRTAGGNGRTPTFFHNPQYSLTIPRPTPLSLLLTTDADDIPVHVDLVWAHGQRVVTALTVRDVVTSSGEYRRGCALADLLTPVDAGTYTVVVSTFDPGQLADFVLRVGSDVQVSLRPVLSDAAGRLRTEVQPAVFRNGESERKRARLSISRLTRTSVVARSGVLGAAAAALSLSSSSAAAAAAASFAGGGGRQLPPFSNNSGGHSSNRPGPSTRANSGTSSPISIPVSVRVSIEYGPGPGLGPGLGLRSTHNNISQRNHSYDPRGTTTTTTTTAVVTNDGEFADASMVLRTEDVDLDPDMARRCGGLWLVVEQMGGFGFGHGVGGGGGVGGVIDVEVLSDGRIGVGEWEEVDD